MPIKLFLMKKWWLMLIGKSHYHVNQNEGLYYSKDNLEGYYNNLTEKITRFGRMDLDVPVIIDDQGKTRYFSIAIFQYGLAAFDLYLANANNRMKEIVKNCCQWAIVNQNNNGTWDTFKEQNAFFPYSSMAQGEGISLLVRGAKLFKNHCYEVAAQRAKEAMLRDINEEGTCKIINGKYYFYEYTFMPLILNGWIFSAWGLFDYYKYFKDNEVKKIWENTVEEIADSLDKFDNGYWSKYDTSETITSPFYHKLHIAQLNVLYTLTGNEKFKEYAERWKTYYDCQYYRIKAFIVKALQKIKE